MVDGSSVAASFLVLMVSSTPVDLQAPPVADGGSGRISLAEIQLIDRSIGAGIFAMLDSDHDSFLDAAEYARGVLAGLLPRMGQ